MSYAAYVLRKGARRVLWWQGGIALSVGLVAFFFGGHPDNLARFLAALAGGFVAMSGTLILALTVARTDGGSSSAQAQLWLYGGAAVRFLLALILLGLGLGVLHLAPLPFLVAFGLGQVAFLAPGISSGL